MLKKLTIKRKREIEKQNSKILESTSTENLKDEIKYCNDSFFLYNQWWKERIKGTRNKNYDSSERQRIYEKRINELGKTIFDYYRS